MDSYRKADGIMPGFSTLKIGHVYLFTVRYARAESCYSVGASGDDKWGRSEARTYLAVIPLYRGRFEDALGVPDRAMAAARRTGDVLRAAYPENPTFVEDFYAHALARAGSVGEAEEALHGLEVAPEPYFFIRSMLGEAYLEAGKLGRAYEESGWSDKAIEQYETFLDIWNDADPGIPALEDARRRLHNLKGGT
jgi:tetratricopeptide (TPR) repeat protein